MDTATVSISAASLASSKSSEVTIDSTTLRILSSNTTCYAIIGTTASFYNGVNVGTISGGLNVGSATGAGTGDIRTSGGLALNGGAVNEATINSVAEVNSLSAVNIITDTTTGTKIGTATTQKLGFFNATPVVQRAGAAQAAVATTGATNTTPYGFTTAAQANAIITLLNEIRATLVELGLMKGAA